MSLRPMGEVLIYYHLKDSSLYFARDTLSNAIAGRLMVVFDIDHLTVGYGPDFHSLTDNMVKLP